MASDFEFLRSVLPMATSRLGLGGILRFRRCGESRGWLRRNGDYLVPCLLVLQPAGPASHRLLVAGQAWTAASLVVVSRMSHAMLIQHSCTVPATTSCLIFMRAASLLGFSTQGWLRICPAAPSKCEFLELLHRSFSAPLLLQEQDLLLHNRVIFQHRKWS